MSLGGLDTALSGLRIAQQQIGVISNNVSNVNTPGYTRKILPQSTVAIEGESVGVRGNSIIRKVDINLERDFWTQVSNVSGLDTKATFLNKIQQFHGPPELEMSIAAEIAALQNAFVELADSPEDSFLQTLAVQRAQATAAKMRDFGKLLTQMRNDAQDKIEVSVNKVNDKLEQIATLNKQIKFNLVSGKTVAALEDQRSEALQELSQEMNISFFTRGDGVLVVQTARGVQLADERAETVYFRKEPVGPQSFYPDANNPFANSIYIGGNPQTTTSAINITTSGIGGNMGALLDLRDEILPRQQALLDEMAHKMAMRFDQQGLRMFTDAVGQIPDDTPPDPTTLPNPTPVSYVGFASVIQVNTSIVNDHTLVQTGTVPTDMPVQSGSNEVIRRIIEFTFGETHYEIAEGSHDLLASGAGETLQSWLGLYSQNQVTGSVDLSGYSSVSALMAAGGNVFIPSGSPQTTQFEITFEEPRTGLGPFTIGIDLDDIDAAFPIGAPNPLTGGTIENALDQMAAFIDDAIAGAGLPPEIGAGVRTTSYGQLVIESHGNITMDGLFPGGMREEGLAFLGFDQGTTVTKDPYIDVQVGNDPPVRIFIEPGDDENDLLAKLDKTSPTDNGVPGLAVELDPVTGFLSLRPGDDFNNPRFGGDIKITGGNFVTNGTGLSPDGIPAGTGIIEALFGSPSPVESIGYMSETTAGSGNFVPFRTRNLGQGANINTGIISSSTLVDYGQKLVNRQTDEINAIEGRKQDEGSFRDLLQRRLLDESGVNLDEELSNLIVVQTAFAAAARVISAIDENFRELLNAVR